MGSTRTIIIITIVLGIYECGALQNGCSDPDERCVPIRLCPRVFKRIENGEYTSNKTFSDHVKSKWCNPVVKTDNQQHICCSKSHIECQLNGERGACLLREECLLLKNTTERNLLKSAEQNLCYVHDARNYFCCTDPYCAHHKRLCETREIKPVSIRYPSLYPSCSVKNGTVGSLVPKVLCRNRSRSIKTTSDDRVCCLSPANPNQLLNHKNAQKLANAPCGMVGYQDKLKNGTYTQRGEFPWMAIMVHKKTAYCSGTLIHPSYVLTAGHCLRNGPIGVRLGVYNIQEKSEHEQVIRVAEMIRNLNNDVGLVRLTKPAQLDIEQVWPICLPVYQSTLTYLPPKVIITGWRMKERDTYTDTLMKSYAQVLTNNTECTLDRICVDRNNHCYGDAGGPYQALSTYGGKSRFVQYGIITSKSCNQSSREHISSSVLLGSLLNWILDNMVI